MVAHQQHRTYDFVDEIIHLNQPEAFKEVFRVVIQLGAILAVVTMYFNRLNPFSRQKTSRQRTPPGALWIKIGSLACRRRCWGCSWTTGWRPTCLTPTWWRAMLIIYGVLLILVENSRRFANPDLQKVDRSIQTAFYIGMFQVLSLVPAPPAWGHPSWEP